MMKQVLAGCSLLALLALGIPVQAQSQAPAPSAPAPAAPQQNVSPDELKKFATAVKQLLAITQTAETQMSAVVQKQGLTEARFNEIYRSKRDPAAKPATQVTQKEEQSYNQAVTQLAQIQKDAQTKMDQAVKDQGLPMQRFNEIFTAVKGNPQLRQEVQKMIQTN